MTRLRHERDPIGWFLHQVWDRVVNRPLWCSQEAVRNVRDEADVVLYLVNATEDPETAGYLQHELELLSWMNRPVLVRAEPGRDGRRRPARWSGGGITSRRSRSCAACSRSTRSAARGWRRASCSSASWRCSRATSARR